MAVSLCSIRKGAEPVPSSKSGFKDRKALSQALPLTLTISLRKVLIAEKPKAQGGQRLSKIPHTGSRTQVTGHQVCSPLIDPLDLTSAHFPSWTPQLVCIQIAEHSVMAWWEPRGKLPCFPADSSAVGPKEEPGLTTSEGTRYQKTEICIGDENTNHRLTLTGHSENGLGRSRLYLIRCSGE